MGLEIKPTLKFICTGTQGEFLQQFLVLLLAFIALDESIIDVPLLSQQLLNPLILVEEAYGFLLLFFVELRNPLFQEGNLYTLGWVFLVPALLDARIEKGLAGALPPAHRALAFDEFPVVEDYHLHIARADLHLLKGFGLQRGSLCSQKRWLVEGGLFLYQFQVGGALVLRTQIPDFLSSLHSIEYLNKLI